MFQTAPQYAEQNVQLAEELIESWRISVIFNRLSGPLLIASNAFLVMGKRTQAEKIWGELRVLAKRRGDLFVLLLSATMEALLAVMDGRMEDALNITEQIRSRAEEAGVTGAANSWTAFPNYLTQVHLHKNLEDLARIHRTDFQAGNAITGARLCLVLAHLGQKEEVSKILERFVVKRPGIGTPDDLTALLSDTLFLEAAVLTGHRPASDLLLNRFASTGVVTPGYEYATCIPRHMGGAAALLERYDEARQYYQEAIKVCTEMKFRPELALSRLELAELLLKHYPQEKSEAIAHLDFVIPEFRDMKMQSYLEKALRHKEILKA
jgi:tetratricopeptide (TPR) repeat protein